mmetsp:Transcript_22192/g.33658  ORF Transcript_22192/g.33658 Transcript_22192/m.33658 type:complete len:411 (-) Transcript_22192:182-1414(-)
MASQTHHGKGGLYARVVDKALEKVVPSIMELVDIDGVVRRIDIDDAVQRIDIDTLLQRVEWNSLLDRVDWNRQMKRIDFDDIIQRVDIDSVAAQSTSGIFTQMMDVLRIRLVAADLFLLVMARYRCSESRAFLPPVPGGRQRKDRVRFPPSRNDKAIAVQGRYCGFFSKAIAIFLDVGIVISSFSLFLVFLDFVCQFVTTYYLKIWQSIIFPPVEGGEEEKDDNYYDDNTAEEYTKIRQTMGLMTIVLHLVASFFYFFWTVLLTNQTIGMAIVGIKVVNSRDSHKPLTACQVFLRTLLLPVTLILLPIPLAFVGLFRRDGRMFHDLTAKTGMIYLWNARVAKLRAKKMEQIENTDACLGSVSFSPSPVRLPSRHVESFHTAASGSFSASSHEIFDARYKAMDDDSGGHLA